MLASTWVVSQVTYNYTNRVLGKGDGNFLSNLYYKSILENNYSKRENGVQNIQSCLQVISLTMSRTNLSNDIEALHIILRTQENKLMNKKNDLSKREVLALKKVAFLLGVVTQLQAQQNEPEFLRQLIATKTFDWTQFKVALNEKLLKKSAEPLVYRIINQCIHEITTK